MILTIDRSWIKPTEQRSYHLSHPLCLRSRSNHVVQPHLFTSCNPEHPHDPHDCRVHWHEVRLELLEDDAQDGEEDDGHVQLVPSVAHVSPGAQSRNLHAGLNDKDHGEKVVEHLQRVGQDLKLRRIFNYILALNKKTRGESSDSAQLRNCVTCSQLSDGLNVSKIWRRSFWAVWHLPTFPHDQFPTNHSTRLSDQQAIRCKSICFKNCETIVLSTWKVWYL